MAERMKDVDLTGESPDCLDMVEMVQSNYEGIFALMVLTNVSTEMFPGSTAPRIVL